MNCELNMFHVSKWEDIDELFSMYRIADFELRGYASDDAIKVEMIAPKSL